MKFRGSAQNFVRDFVRKITFREGEAGYSVDISRNNQLSWLFDRQTKHQQFVSNLKNTYYKKVEEMTKAAFEFIKKSVKELLSGLCQEYERL